MGYFSKISNISSWISKGKPFWKTGKPFWKTGKPFWKTGKPFWKTGKPFWKTGKPFRKTGKPFRKTGKPFWKTVIESRKSEIKTAILIRMTVLKGSEPLKVENYLYPSAMKQFANTIANIQKNNIKHQKTKKNGNRNIKTIKYESHSGRFRALE